MTNGEIERLVELCDKVSKTDNPELRELAGLARKACATRSDMETVGILGRESHYRWQAADAQRKALEEQYVVDMEGLSLCAREERVQAEEQRARADRLSAALAALLAEVAPTGTTGGSAVRTARELLKGVA